MNMGTFDLECVKAVLGPFRTFSHKWAVTAHRRVKRTKFGLGCISCMNMGTFDLEHVKVILGSLSPLFSKFGRNSKRAHRRANGRKFWPACMNNVLEMQQTNSL